MQPWNLARLDCTSPINEYLKKLELRLKNMGTKKFYNWTILWCELFHIYFGIAYSLHATCFRLHRLLRTQKSIRNSPLPSFRIVKLTIWPLQGRLVYVQISFHKMCC